MTSSSSEPVAVPPVDSMVAGRPWQVATAWAAGDGASESSGTASSGARSLRMVASEKVNGVSTALMHDRADRFATH
jgi:hypothetical protein